MNDFQNPQVNILYNLVDSIHILGSVRVVLPKIFGYELVLNKVGLDDVTVVNVVCSLFYHSSGCMADHLSVFLNLVWTN